MPVCATTPCFPQVGLSLGVLGVSVDSSGQYGAASSLDSYVTVWRMDDYNTGAALLLGWDSFRRERDWQFMSAGAACHMCVGSTTPRSRRPGPPAVEP